MSSPKRIKVNNGNSRNHFDDDEGGNNTYPPTQMAKDGISPYFIGKPRRKKVAERSVISDAPPPSLLFRESTEEEDEQIIIEEDEIVDITPERVNKNQGQKLMDTFIKSKQADENETTDISYTRSGEVVASSIIPKIFNRQQKGELSTAKVQSRRIKGFDFSDDPTVNRIRDKICEIVDPTGEHRSNQDFLDRMQNRAIKGIELVAEPRKKKKGNSKTSVANINVYPNFTTASGQDVHKTKFINPLSENEKNARKIECNRQNSANNCNVSSSSTIPGVHPRKSVPEVTRKPSFTAPFIKKAMGMETNGGGQDEMVRGLRAEPSLKNFDENIISLIESEIMSVNTEIGWADVAGLDGAKKALREIVVLPFKRPDVFTGIRAPPKGVLLFGPPGTGKTMIGRCVASQCKATFFNISASSLTSKWVGEGEKLVRALFAVARLKLPSVIFIDEVDSLLSSRSESEHESSRRIKTEFLVQLDGVNTAPDERLLVLGATNRPQELDEAARRRFQKRLYIALPEPQSRIVIVQNLLKETKNDIDENNLQKISQITDGYSGADMRQLCTEAAMGPIRDIGDQIETIDKDDIRAVNLRDFIQASRVVRPTVDDSQLDAYASWDRKFGCLPPSK